MDIDALVREAKAAAASAPFDPAAETIVKYTGHRVIEECMREVLAVQVQSPDAQIVKDKINAQLRILAAKFR